MFIAQHLWFSDLTHGAVRHRSVAGRARCAAGYRRRGQSAVAAPRRAGVGGLPGARHGVRLGRTRADSVRRLRARISARRRRPGPDPVRRRPQHTAAGVPARRTAGGAARHCGSGADRGDHGRCRRRARPLAAARVADRQRRVIDRRGRGVLGVARQRCAPEGAHRRGSRGGVGLERPDGGAVDRAHHRSGARHASARMGNRHLSRHAVRARNARRRAARLGRPRLAAPRASAGGWALPGPHRRHRLRSLWHPHDAARQRLPRRLSGGRVPGVRRAAI